LRRPSGPQNKQMQQTGGERISARRPQLICVLGGPETP
jgi:hypothetical protein